MAGITLDKTNLTLLYSNNGTNIAGLSSSPYYDESTLAGYDYNAGDIRLLLFIPSFGYKITNRNAPTLVANIRGSTGITRNVTIAPRDMTETEEAYFTQTAKYAFFNSPQVLVYVINTDSIPSNVQAINSITFTENNCCTADTNNTLFDSSFGDNDKVVFYRTANNVEMDITAPLKDDIKGASSYQLRFRPKDNYQMAITGTNVYEYMHSFACRRNTNGFLTATMNSAISLTQNNRILTTNFTNAVSNDEIKIIFALKSGVVESKTSAIDINYNLTGCTVSPMPLKYEENDVLSYTFTPTSGSEFRLIPTLTATGNKNGVASTETINAVLSDGVYTLSFNTNSEWSDVTAITVTASATVKCAITYTIAHCTVSPRPTEYNDGTALVFTITPDNYSAFITAPTLAVSGKKNGNITTETINAVLSNGVYTLSFNTNSEWADMASIALTAESVKGSTITYALTNASVNPRPTFWEEGSVASIEFLPDTGYYFENTPTVIIDGKINGDYHSAYSLQVYTDSTTGNYKADIGRIYTLTDVNSITVTANARAITPVQDKYGIISIYHVTRQILTQIASRRFIQSSQDSTQFLDLGKYITGLRRFPFAITDGANKNIILGGHDLEIQAPEIENDIIEIELESVELNGLYGNSYDTANCRIELHLPYIGLISIPNRCVNTVIKIVYKIGLLSGGCVAEIYSNGKLVTTADGNIAINVPYIFYESSGDNVIQGGISDNLRDFEPCINIIENPLANNRGVFNTNKYDLIGNETGYFTAIDVELESGDMTETEKEMIAQLLRGGVHI